MKKNDVLHVMFYRINRARYRPENKKIGENRGNI